MKYAAKTLKHYLRLSLKRAGVAISSDMHVEIDGIADDLVQSYDQLQDRIKELEARVERLMDASGVSG